MKDVIASFQGQILANDVAMEELEVTAKNGQIYTLAGVLIPPSIIPILPHRCDETKREMKLVRQLGKEIRVPKQAHKADSVSSSPNSEEPSPRRFLSSWRARHKLRFLWGISTMIDAA